jgi:hypothetical protein
MSRDEVLVHPQFERLIAYAKLQLSASEIAMRTQLRADESALKAAAVDPWPKLLARWEAAKLEAQALRQSCAAEERQARPDFTESAAAKDDAP